MGPALAPLYARGGLSGLAERRQRHRQLRRHLPHVPSRSPRRHTGPVDVGAKQWWLGAQLPPSRPESKADLEILREVSEEEERQTREANAFLNRLASAAPYARLVELYQELEQTRGRDLFPARRASQLNRVARAL